MCDQKVQIRVSLTDYVNRRSRIVTLAPHQQTIAIKHTEARLTWIPEPEVDGIQFIPRVRYYFQLYRVQQVYPLLPLETS